MSANRIVINPAAGEQHVRLATDTNRITVFGAGRGARDPHVDARGEKRITVVRGRMAISCNGRVTTLHAGETIAIAPGVEHAWWSTRAGELCVEVQTAGGQECVVTGTTRSWRSWSWSSLVPTGWVPSASR